MNDSRQRYWQKRLALQSPAAAEVRHAVEPILQLKGGRSKPVLFSCDNDTYFVVKGKRPERHAIADRIVGALAELVGFPVPTVSLVDVPDPLISQPDSICSHLSPGIWHGSLWIGDCDEYRYVRWVEDADNRERFSDLAILFGTMLGDDRQFLYEQTFPHRVWSHDHGAFLNLEETWDQTLCSYLCSSQRAIESDIIANADCPGDMLINSARRLDTITDEQIASVIGSIPEHWGLTGPEKPLLCEFISISKKQIVDVAERRGVA